MFIGIGIIDFRKQFKTEEDCLKYLVDIKWGNGYKCIKCGHNEYYKGRQWFYRRCRLCMYDESVTAGTLFHKCKLGLLRAFEMAFRICVRKKGMSTCELGKELGCQQKSAWLFKAKLQEAMKSSEQHQLQGKVEIDEFMVGGFEQQAPGRTHGEKSLVVLAVERVIDKKGNENLGRAYARVIDDASAESLKTIFEKHIAKEAEAKTDGWRGYIPLKKEWNINQELSNKGERFKLLHTHVMNIKGWLRGIHHKCSSKRLQNYLNEYHFRFNRRGFMDTILHNLIGKSMNMQPIPYTKLKVCELNT